MKISQKHEHSRKGFVWLFNRKYVEQKTSRLEQRSFLFHKLGFTGGLTWINKNAKAFFEQYLDGYDRE